jgi:hypothetical protein
MSDRIDHCPHLSVFDLLHAGALTEGTTTYLQWGEKTCQLAAQRGEILLDDGARQQRIAIVWHSPLPWIGKPLFVCPNCNQKRQRLFEWLGVIACQFCHGLQRPTPSGRIERLRRTLGVGVDPHVFGELPPPVRPSVRYDRKAARIRAAEAKLLDQISDANRNFERWARRRGMLLPK